VTDDEVVERLLLGIDAYDRDGGLVYDEIFREVHDRIASNGDAGKIDIAAIAVWKRSAQGAWTGPLLGRPEAEVRAATSQAFSAEDDRAALGSLAVLPGYERQEALPTALLCAYDPVRYAVMDRRALAALASLGLGVGRTRGMTLRYLAQVRELRDQLADVRPGTTARDVDKGLFMVGEGLVLRR